MPQRPKSSSDATTPEALADRLERLAGQLRHDPALAGLLGAEVRERLAHWEAAVQEAPARATEPIAAAEAQASAGADGLIRIWCDGSCAPNPGPGGWGAIVERNGDRSQYSGASPDSTNNIMEMTAAIEALRQTPPGASIEVTTDSRYVMDGITKWVKGWKRRNWRKADGAPVLNRELWMTLDALAAERQVEWRWVRGHTGHAENEQVDRLANAAREALK